MNPKSDFVDGECVPDVEADPAAASAVMRCEQAGLRAYALAGGLDPASDFKGLDLRGWDLEGQDLSGFDLSNCDLRGTRIEHAIIGNKTNLTGAILDDGIVAGSHPEHADRLTITHLKKIHDWVVSLNRGMKNEQLSCLRTSILPLLELQFGQYDI